jgi:hypothetical protein
MSALTHEESVTPTTRATTSPTRSSIAPPYGGPPPGPGFLKGQSEAKPTSIPTVMLQVVPAFEASA